MISALSRFLTTEKGNDAAILRTKVNSRLRHSDDGAPALHSIAADGSATEPVNVQELERH